MDPRPSYVLLLDTDLNRVFNDAVADVAATELRLVVDGRAGAAAGPSGVDDGAPAAGEPLTDEASGLLGPIETVVRGRTRSLRFPCALPVDDLAGLVGQLSASAALFLEHPATDPSSPTLLEPITIDERLVYGTDLATTQRYRGKTNERLTRAMVNLALATAGIDPATGDRLDATAAVRLLDPMCGRGTTLNWALAYGLDAIGIETDRSSLDQHRTFLETWAKRQRLPHKATRHRDGNGEQRSLTMRIAPDRATQKAGGGQTVETFHADGADDGLPIGAGSIDVVVTDLPYGVQHRGAGRGGPDGNSGRRPNRGPSADGPAARPPSNEDTAELLERVLPTWWRWLRPGGAVCLAWNLKQADRDIVSAALARSGFDPIVARGGFTMRHTVDATIDRDVIVARRLAHRPR